MTQWLCTEQAQCKVLGVARSQSLREWTTFPLQLLRFGVETKTISSPQPGSAGVITLQDSEDAEMCGGCPQSFTLRSTLAPVV